MQSDSLNPVNALDLSNDVRAKIEGDVQTHETFLDENLDLSATARERLFLWCHAKEEIAQITQEYGSKVQAHLRQFGPSQCTLTISLKGFCLDWGRQPSHSLFTSLTKQAALEGLRELIKEPLKPEPLALKPRVFRNDQGVVISERAWNQLQAMKQKAREGGYEIDEYSQ